jgi:hypothetical protein
LFGRPCTSRLTTMTTDDDDSGEESPLTGIDLRLLSPLSGHFYLISSLLISRFMPFDTDVTVIMGAVESSLKLHVDDDTYYRIIVAVQCVLWVNTLCVIVAYHFLTGNLAPVCRRGARDQARETR